MAEQADPLARLVEQVRRSAKYRCISPELIQSVGARELARRRNWRQAVKATRDKLHQVGGAYLDRRVDYARWLGDLRAAVRSGDRAALLAACARIMGHHTSSRERLEILAPFYAATLGLLPPIHSLLDVACGLNPLAIPWMPLAADVEYHACDIYQDMIGFLGEALPLLGVRGSAQAIDVIQSCPTRRVDLALLLKTLPCLEQVDKSAGRRLLDTVNADHLLVSYPVHSLGGAEKGMAASYEAHFRELVAGRPWQVRRFEFATELAFLVSKQG